MNFELQKLTLTQSADLTVDAQILLWPQAGWPGATGALADWVAQVQRQGDLEEGVGQYVVGYRLAATRSRLVVLVRVGEGAATQVRKAVGAAMGALKGQKLKSLVVQAGALGGAALATAVQAVADATYVYQTTRTQGTPRTLSRVVVGVTDTLAVKSAFQQACATVTGVELAKEWANRPGNHATPTHLAQVARQLGKRSAITTEVLGPREVARLGMGAFMAVAQGSDQPLRFIVMRYQGAAKSSAPVVLVGKGITFDTGGISIKPAPDMDEMKFDMGGAASVLGVFGALAELQPAINVVGLIPSCENMPDGKAVKPGDVVTSMSGQTIEILNTDAEGRLILCDALTYAERFKPRSIVDIATLTGACVIALGAVRTGLFAVRDDLAAHLAEAGDVALDPCWRMPLDDEYAEGLKSNFADMGNVGGRQAGAVTAAKFLQKFVRQMNWAHLDIAGTAWKSGAAKGATGRPVPMLLQYLVDEAARLRLESPKAKPARKAMSKAADGAASKPARKRATR